MSTFVLDVKYNRKSRGYDITCKRGHYGLDSILRCYGQPILIQADRYIYYVPEIYHQELAEALADADFPITQTMEYFLSMPPTTDETFVPLVTNKGTSLREYQVEACKRLQAGHLLLGDDLGLGKTLSVIHAWHNLPNNDLSVMVAVVPNEDVAGDWLECLSTHFLPDTCAAYMIRDRRMLTHLEKDFISGSLLLIPYSKVWREGYFEFIEGLCKFYRVTLVLDEAHRISRVGSNQHRGVYSLATKACRVWCLSGTEVSNTPDQYYGMYLMVRQPDMSSYLHRKPDPVTEKAWIDYYRNTEERNQWHSIRLRGLHVLRQSFALRRTKEQVQPELPPLTEIDCPIIMDQTTRTIYRELETECQAELQRQGNPEILKEDHFWVIYLRLIQLCSHPLLLGEERVNLTPKWERLSDILSDAIGSQKVIIWSNFPDTINWIADTISRHFPWATVEAAHGRVSKAERADIKDRVKAGEVDVVVANPAIWGEGVNLQACTVMVYWDYHPSLVRWRQSQGRCHRMGQTNPVTIYRLAYRNSVDIKLINWLTEKGRLSRLITGE